MFWLFFFYTVLASPAAIASDAVSTCGCIEWGLDNHPEIFEKDPSGLWNYNFTWDSPHSLEDTLWSWSGLQEYARQHTPFMVRYNAAYDRYHAVLRRTKANFRISSCCDLVNASRNLESINYEGTLILPNLRAKYQFYIPHRWGQSNQWHLAQGASKYSDEKISEDRKKAADDYIHALKRIDYWEEHTFHVWDEIYEHCRSLHRCKTVTYEQGLLQHHRGDHGESARRMVDYVNISRDLGETRSLTLNDYVHLSTCSMFSFQYEQAIQALDEAIAKYPDKKELYIHRITAYFEQGQFDEAIADFIQQGLDERLREETDPKKIALANAFLLGASHGLVEGAQEYPSSILYGLRGAGQLLWAGMTNPIGVPAAMMSGIDQTITLLRNREYNEILQAMAPELGDLCKEWESLEKRVQSERAGFVFGKYGFDWLAFCGQKKLLDACIHLRSTNTLCNVKTCLSAENKAAVVLTAEQTATRRAEYFKTTTIQWDKQGKHIEGHNSWKNLLPDDRATKSILTHKDPESLLRTHAGKGAPNSIREGHLWEVGYKEDVNFGETIGVWKSRDGKHSEPSKWGRIAYDKEGGAHIYPIKPRTE